MYKQCITAIFLVAGIAFGTTKAVLLFPSNVLQQNSVPTVAASDNSDAGLEQIAAGGDIKQNFVCDIADCTRTEIHEHSVCSIPGCTENSVHKHNGVYCYAHSNGDGHAYHTCGVAGCTQTENHQHCEVAGCTQTGNHQHCDVAGCIQTGNHQH